MEEIVKEYWKGRESGKHVGSYIFPFTRALREKIEALGWEPNEIVLVGIGRDARPILDLLDHEEFFKNAPKSLLPLSRGHVVVERLTHTTGVRKRLKIGDRSVLHELRRMLERLMGKNSLFKREVERIGNMLRRSSKNGRKLLVLLDCGHLGTQPLIIQAIAEFYKLPSITAILYAYPASVKNVHDVVGNTLRTEFERANAIYLWERFPKFVKPLAVTQYRKTEDFEKQFAKYVARLGGVIHEVYGREAAQAWLRKYLHYWKDAKIKAAMRHLLAH